MIANATSTTSTSEDGVYTVQVSVGGCSSEVSANAPVVITGDIHNESAIRLSALPEPGFAEIVRGRSMRTGCTFNVFTLNGRNKSVFQSFKEVTELDVADYSQGLYVLKVNNGLSAQTLKFIKE